MRFYDHCEVCGDDLIDDLPPNTPTFFINVYRGRKLISTYCSTHCLKNDFRTKKKVKHHKFLWWKWNDAKTIWVSKKKPNIRYRVIFYDDTK